MYENKITSYAFNIEYKVKIRDFKTYLAYLKTRNKDKSCAKVSFRKNVHSYYHLKFVCLTTTSSTELKRKNCRIFSQKRKRISVEV